MQFKPHHNQRQYSRSQVNIAATLTPKDGEPFGAEVADLSMNGALIRTDKRLEPGTQCKLNMLLGHFRHELPLVADSTVVRCINHGIALKFDSVELESIPTIQNLIIDHAEDPEQSELEFSSHGGWVFTPR